MNRSRIAAVLVGAGASLVWPVSIGAASVDDTHAVTVDDHSSHGAPAHAQPEAKPAKPAKKSATDTKHGTPSGSNSHDAPADKHDAHDEPASNHEPAKPTTPTPVSKTSDAGKASAHAPASSTTAKTGEGAGTPNSDEALTLITEGNQRWVNGKPTSPNVEPSRRTQLAENGQKPFVTVLTCADSRVPIERVFDRGVGDVFVVRVAGNVAGTSETGTIEYGVGHLKTPLLVVMGHTKCGAVAAAASGASVHGKLGELLDAIKPAVDRTKRNNPSVEPGTVAALAVRENVWQSVFDLIKGSEEIRTMIGKSELKVVGAVYDISTGKVEFMGEHPWQSELVEAMNARAAGRSQTAGAESHH